MVNQFVAGNGQRQPSSFPVCRGAARVLSGWRGDLCEAWAGDPPLECVNNLDSSVKNIDSCGLVEMVLISQNEQSPLERRLCTETVSSLRDTESIPRIIFIISNPASSHRPNVAVGRISLSRIWLLGLFVGRITVRTQSRRYAGRTPAGAVIQLHTRLVWNDKWKQTGRFQSFRRASFAPRSELNDNY